MEVFGAIVAAALTIVGIIWNSAVLIAAVGLSVLAVTLAGYLARRFFKPVILRPAVNADAFSVEIIRKALRSGTFDAEIARAVARNNQRRST